MDLEFIMFLILIYTSLSITLEDKPLLASLAFNKRTVCTKISNNFCIVFTGGATTEQYKIKLENGPKIELVMNPKYI